MSVPASGKQGLQDGPGRLLVIADVRAGAVAALKVSSRNVTPTPSVPPTSFSVAGVHGLPFIISANRASRTQMTLPSWASPATAWFRNSFCSLVVSPGFSGSLPKARPNAASTFLAWSRSKRSTAARVPAFDEPNLELPQEAGHRHPEIIPHHDDALHAAAVALPQGLHQFGVLFVLLRMEPLLELVEHDQHLLAHGDALSPAQRRQRFLQRQVRRQARTAFPQAAQQPGFRFLGGGLDVDGDHVCRTSRGSRPALTSDDLPQPDGP